MKNQSLKPEWLNNFRNDWKKSFAWITLITGIIGGFIFFIINWAQEKNTISNQIEQVKYQIAQIDSQIIKQGDYIPDEVYQNKIKAYKQILESKSDLLTDKERAELYLKIGDQYQLFCMQSQHPEIELFASEGNYKVALMLTGPSASKLKARIENNIANTYNMLSHIRDTEKYLKMCIVFYKRAQVFFDPANYPIEYATNENNLGFAYSNLGILKNSSQYLDSALAFHRRSLKTFTESKHPDDFARSNIGIGNVLIQLSPYHNGDPNYPLIAIRAYVKALKYKSPEKYPIANAKLLNGIASGFKEISKIKQPIKNLAVAEVYFIQSKTILMSVKSYLEYSKVSYNLGRVYIDFNLATNKKVYLHKAISVLKDALIYRNLIDNPIEYANTCEEMGKAYKLLSNSENYSANQKLSKEYFNNALSVFTSKNYPIDFLRVTIEKTKQY